MPPQVETKSPLSQFEPDAYAPPDKRPPLTAYTVTMVIKDKVTSPLRAAFTELEGEAGPAELSEASRGSGARKAIGELLACPYCLGLWVVAAFSVGLLFAPRLTRFVASTMAALTISDFLQVAYKAAEEKGLGG